MSLPLLRPAADWPQVLLARVLSRDPKVVVVSQPTRGLDVGASEYVREELLARRADGAAVLLMSEDLDELVRIATERFGLSETRLSAGRRVPGRRAPAAARGVRRVARGAGRPLPARVVRGRGGIRGEAAAERGPDRLRGGRGVLRPGRCGLAHLLLRRRPRQIPSHLGGSSSSRPPLRKPPVSSPRAGRKMPL